MFSLLLLFRRLMYSASFFVVVVVSVGARLLVGYTCSKVFRPGVVLLGLLW